MTFDREKEAVEALYAGLDKACRSGVFSLQEAAGVMNEVAVISNHFNGGLHTILAQLIQPPSETQAPDAVQPPVVAGAADPDPEKAEDSKPKVAKSR